MNELKYITVDTGLCIIAYVFPSLINHADFARNISGEVLTAGFCQPYIKDNEIKWSAYGKSFSLKLESNPEIDSQLITRFYGEN